MIVSLHTRSLPKAQRSAAALSDRLERYWDSIRLEVFHTRELGLSLVQEVEADRSSVSVSIEDALDSYLRLKGAGRSKTFFQGAERAVSYLTEATAAEELSSLSAADAARFRDHLIGKGMTAASVRRVFGTVKAITNLAIREYGLACPNVFANVFIPDDEKASTRLPIPDDNLVAIQKECFEPRSTPKQNRSLLSLPFHNPSEVRVTNTPNLRPHPSNQFDSDLATKPSNPSSASTRREASSL